MKVIHLISGGDSGGAKTHVLSLLQNLNKTITAQLVCFRDGPFAEEARAMGIPTMICGGNNIPHLRRELADYIRQGGYQLIHCHGSRANMIGALLREPTGLPVVSTVHSDYKVDHMGRPFARLTFGAINAWALRHLDYRIGVSAAMVDLNCVMDDQGRLIEIQGTGEERPFTLDEQRQLVELCEKGIRRLQTVQRAVLEG